MARRCATRRDGAQKRGNSAPRPASKRPTGLANRSKDNERKNGGLAPVPNYYPIYSGLKTDLRKRERTGRNYPPLSGVNEDLDSRDENDISAKKGKTSSSGAIYEESEEPRHGAVSTRTECARLIKAETRTVLDDWKGW